MNLQRVIDAMALPEAARVDRRVPKTQLTEYGANTGADRRHIQDGIQELMWVAALKPGNVGVPVFQDAEREYLEVAVLTCAARGEVKCATLARLIHRAVPYPVVLWIERDGSVTLSLAHKRRALGATQGVVVEEVVELGGLGADAPTEQERAFIESLAISELPRGDLRALYQGLLDRVTAMEVARVTGVFAMAPSGERARVLREALNTRERHRRALAVLRVQAEREPHLGRRVELNLTIRRLEEELLVYTRALLEAKP